MSMPPTFVTRTDHKNKGNTVQDEAAVPMPTNEREHARLNTETETAVRRSLQNPHELNNLRTRIQCRVMKHILLQITGRA
jgi:hypothetical protein